MSNTFFQEGRKILEGGFAPCEPPGYDSGYMKKTFLPVKSLRLFDFSNG